MKGAIDGDSTSRWTTGTNMAVGDYYQVDFQGLVKLSTIKLDNSQTSGGDLPKSIGVYTSQDGVTFSDTAIDVEVPVVNGVTTFSFPQESMRAIRIKVADTGGAAKWWSIGELKTDCAL